jgi:hypothetical protein
MAEPDRPRSPFAGMSDLSARTPVRVLSPDEIERMLAQHRLYLETEYHQGHRANFSSADVTGQDFSGLNLRRIKMDRAVLKGADFSGANLQTAKLIGAILQETNPIVPTDFQRCREREKGAADIRSRGSRSRGSTPAFVHVKGAPGIVKGAPGIRKSLAELVDANDRRSGASVA